jgi:hypothetical protein
VPGALVWLLRETGVFSREVLVFRGEAGVPSREVLVSLREAGVYLREVVVFSREVVNRPATPPVSSATPSITTAMSGVAGTTGTCGGAKSM